MLLYTSTNDMAELQATIEISVELNRFFNVDLFQRGYYQVQVALKTPLKPVARVEVSDKKENILKDGPPDSSTAFKHCNVCKSRKFQVMYRNEEIGIGDIFIFRINTLVESAKLEKNLEGLDLRLDVQLWSNEEDEHVECDPTMELASSRSLLLHLSPTKGLHHFLPVLFDYFHLSAIEVVIHGTIIALHQPYLLQPKSQKAGKGSDLSTLEAVYFGQKVTAPASAPSNLTSSSVRLQQAHLMHKTICNILLSAHESLQNYLQQYAALIPGINFQLDCKDCLTKLGETVLKVQGVLEEDDLIQTALTDMTQLCAENVLLWAQFLEIVLKQSQIHLHLAIEHHNQRVRRFAEGFFTLEHNKSSCLSCYDPDFHGHSSLASLVKSSPYFCNLPSLGVECIELDGDQNTLPVIFEDIFCDGRASLPQVHPKSMLSTTKINTNNLSRDHSSSKTSKTSVPDDKVATSNTKKRSSTRKSKKVAKPESLKSQSSYRCRESQTMPALFQGVTLTAYRKIISPDSLTSGKDTMNHIERAQTLPVSSSLSTACFKSDNHEPVPDPALTNSSHLATSINQSDPTDSALTSRSSVTNSATLVESPCIYLKETSLSSAPSSAVTSMPSTVQSSEDSTVVSTSINDSSHSESAKDNHSSSKLLDIAQENLASNSPKLIKEDLNRLVDDINKALGEIEPVEELDRLTTDVSKIEYQADMGNKSHVTNGFDDASSIYKQDVSISESSIDKVVIPIELSTHNPTDQQTSSSLHKQVNSNCQASDANKINSAPDAKAISLAPVPSINKLEEQNIGHKLTKSESATLAAPPSISSASNVSSSLTDPNLKMTAMELFREEYKNSLKNGIDNPAFDPNFISLDNHVDNNELDNSSTTAQLDNVSELNAFGCQRASSDSDILKNCEVNQRSSHHQTSELLKHKIILNGTDKRRSFLTSSSSYPELSQSIKPESVRLVSVIGQHTVNFVHLRESLKLQMNFPGHLYSECPALASSIPYFYVPSDMDESSSGIHLIVCVHGLDGNSADLRLVRTFIEIALPGFKLDFLMSERNQQDTFADFDKMTDRLVDEILNFLDTFGLQVTRISFVGHSLGNIIIRSALSRPEMSHLLPKLYTLLSLSGPHLGTLYNTSGLVNMGLWFMQKWKKSSSLLQLSLKDHSDPRQTFLYKLSQKPVLQYFKHILLVGSNQDRYVPYHSSRIEICMSAQKDSSITGAVYREMVQNILEPIIQSPHCTLIRYDVFHALPSTANTMIGRAAHIAVLDSEIFIEKFLAVTGLQYFY